MLYGRILIELTMIFVKLVVINRLLTPVREYELSLHTASSSLVERFPPFRTWDGGEMMRKRERYFGGVASSIPASSVN